MTNDAEDHASLTTFDDLTIDKLTPLGFDDPAHACHILRDMAGHNVSDSTFDAMLRIAGGVLAKSAGPDRAVANLGRWADASGNRASAYALLSTHPRATEMLLTIFAASQFLSNQLINTPEYLEILINPRIRDREREPDKLWDDLSRRVSIMKTANARRDALRRFKPPEILRIGARDLLGYADHQTTTRAISDFADASLRMALQICAEEQGATNPPFAIIAMGKHGGREVNYSSDLDLIFVHDEPKENLTPTLSLERRESSHGDGFNPIKLAEAVRDAMARPTDAGFIFRVDLRLRPEGRFGPISRSIDSCRAYYESWAEAWERQALIKARFVAGDPEVGRAFVEIAETFAYRSRVEDTFVDAIRENKRRIEDKVAAAGETETNVKEGHGGIRDIEFTVQLFQLIAGGKNPSLRTPNTPEAIDRLTSAGLLTVDEGATLTSSYIFLRDVEHRLQLMDELPIRNLPIDPRELDKFGRRLGYHGGADFMGSYRSHTARVHNLLQRLFYGKTPAASTSIGQARPRAISKRRLVDSVLSSGGPATDKAVLAELAALGYADPKSTLATIRRDIFGTEYGGIHPEAREAFVEIADELVKAAANTSDPDAALRGIDALAVAVPSRFALYRTLHESRGLLPRMAGLAAQSPYLWQMLIQHQELLDLLADDEAMDGSGPLAPHPGGTRPTSREGSKWTIQGLAQWIVRSRLRTGARDIWGLATVDDTLHDVTMIGETVLAAALSIARAEAGFQGEIAVIGLGKLGGAELGYSSDYDVLYVADAGHVAEAADVAKRLQQILKSGLAPFGLSFEVDARLRPDGRKGAMALDIDSYRKYWAESALTWERQAHLKARFVAGDDALGKAFLDAATEFVYGSRLTEEQTGEIRAMKRRIEKERTHSVDDVKLGPGGLADIEWICQLLQLRFGHKRPRLHKTNTLAALIALRDDVRLTQADWEILDTAYRALTSTRNHAFLKAGVSVDAPSPFPAELRSMMAAAREVTLRVFYGE